jgi:transcriptional regulator with XRE-family HTH domain
MARSIPHRFGANLTYERNRRALTMRELAERAQMHSSEISRLERGQRDPQLSTVIRIARALEIPMVELLRGVGREPGRDS